MPKQTLSIPSTFTPARHYLSELMIQKQHEKDNRKTLAQRRTTRKNTPESTLSWILNDMRILSEKGPGRGQSYRRGKSATVQTLQDVLGNLMGRCGGRQDRRQVRTNLKTAGYAGYEEFRILSTRHMTLKDFRQSSDRIWFMF